MANRNTLHISGDTLTVIPRGLDRLWGFRRRIDVPLASIVEVRTEPRPRRVKRGLRYPGLDAYWKVCGTFHPAGERHYWNYAGGGAVLSVRLDGRQAFQQLYLSVGDADASVRTLSAATRD